MRCRKVEKWISDALDGELGERRRKPLQAHLGKCAACRSYGTRLEKIHQQARGVGVIEVWPQYWEDFSDRLGKKIKAGGRQKPAPASAGLRWKWAWAGAVSLLVIVFGLVLISGRGPSPEGPIFSSEAFFNRFDLEIGADPRLEELFAVAIAESLPGEPSPGAEEAGFFFSDDPFFWESLSDEELSLIEKEIAKEIKS